jgi:hypothetical protein
MINKKLVIITAAAVIIVGIIIGITIMLTGSPSDTDLPVVYENTNTVTAAAGTTEGSSTASLPEVDNPGIPVTDDELKVTPEEEEAIKAIEFQQAENPGSVEKSQEQIDVDNIKIKKATEEAAKNPDVVQPVQAKPVETEKAPAEPKKDKDGYIYTKEEAIKIFTSNADAMAQVKDPENKEYAMREHGVTSEQYDALLNQLLTDPYSSTLLTPYFEDFRRGLPIGHLTGFACEWLYIGGDNGDWADRKTN